MRERNKSIKVHIQKLVLGANRGCRKKKPDFDYEYEEETA